MFAAVTLRGNREDIAALQRPTNRDSDVEAKEPDTVSPIYHNAPGRLMYACDAVVIKSKSSGLFRPFYSQSVFYTEGIPGV